MQCRFLTYIMPFIPTTLFLLTCSLCIHTHPFLFPPFKMSPPEVIKSPKVYFSYSILLNTKNNVVTHLLPHIPSPQQQKIYIYSFPTSLQHKLSKTCVVFNAFNRTKKCVSSLFISQQTIFTSTYSQCCKTISASIFFH